MQSSAVSTGVSGWEHPEWNPQPRPRGHHALERLAAQFDTVEISSSFREDLRPEIAAVWVRRVAANPRFRFTAKLHRDFTHGRDLRPERVRSFAAGLQPLRRANRLGCLLLQFPWSFRFTTENRAFLIALRQAFHMFPLAAEMRHASWMRDEAIGTFIDHHLGFCNIDQPEYVKSMPPTAFLTSPIGYVRLHGRNCFRWFQPGTAGSTHRYDYQYSRAELDAWLHRIERIRPYAENTFVIFNNDAGAKAVGNARELRRMIGGEPPQHASGHERAEQDSLFRAYHARAVA